MAAPFEAVRLAIALEKAGLLAEVRGELPPTINDITDDSRAVKAGSCFVAVKGSTKDGHDYLPKAVEAGASCAIVERPMPLTIPSIVVREGRAASAVAAAAFHGEPAASLKFVGVTGTNGKTTTVGLIRHLLATPDSSSASIGTLGVLLGSAGNSLLPGGAGLTTPGPVELQHVLRTLVDTRVKTVTMEVSSHALDQQRVLGVEFDVAVFTNLTRDHLDYHGSMEAYFAAKAKLAMLLRAGGTAVVNADDPAWSALPSSPKTLRFSLKDKSADVRADQVTFEPRGSRWTLVHGEERAEVNLPLIGDFNVANALGAAAAAIATGLDVKKVAERLSHAPQVPGRLEVLSQHPTVLRDYAHTPDALARALVALRPFVKGRLIALFGCGGDRDRGKRPLMAEAARANADYLVVTSDNPRTEDPERILDEIVAPLEKGTYDRIEDRRAAIAHAINLAHPEKDVVLLAGKGHENYQIRGTTSYPFDEAVIVRELLGASK